MNADLDPRLHELHRRLLAFELDDPAARFTFSQRLARENGWTAERAARVILEYKRFLFLAAAAGHPVTPSDAVDQAWHLHLTYTESYWHRLCGEILGRPLHHGPTRGGAAERDKFHDWYARTLESYRAFFASEPPRDLWPPPAARFGRQRWVRVDTRRHWVIPKPRLSRSTSLASLALAASGCAGGLLADLPILLLAGLVLAAVLVGVSIARSQQAEAAGHRKRADGSTSGGCGGSSGGSSGRADRDADGDGDGDSGGADGGGDGGCGGCGGCGS
jgi:hypothetical protein